MKLDEKTPPTTLTNLRLAPHLVKQAKEQAIKQGHGTFSGYIRYLLLQDIKNAAQGK